MFSRLYGVLLPFFVSFLLAWLLDPLVSFIQHKCRVKFSGQEEAVVRETAKKVKSRKK